MTELEKLYYIISLKYSKGDVICFWRPNSAGYTEYVDEAGIYTGVWLQGRENYYNNGIDTLAVEKSQLDKLFKKHTICMWHSANITTLLDTLKLVQSEKEEVPA